MAKYTKKDIIQMVEDDDVEFIRLQFTDIFGALKNVAITASQIEKVLDTHHSHFSRPIHSERRCSMRQRESLSWEMTRIR